METSEDVAKFYRLHKIAEEGEAEKERLLKLLTLTYEELVWICPHPEAIEYNFNIQGHGPVRVCKVCGVEDHSSEGGTPGDEYNYGYPGHVSKTFWKNSEVEVTKDRARFFTFRRQHNWKVSKGQVSR